MRLTLKIFIFPAIMLAALACNQQDSKSNFKPILEVGGNFLYADDLSALIPEGTSAADSATIAETFIRNWVTNTLLYQKAKKNIHNKDEINKLVEKYQRTLIIEQYQQYLINNRTTQDPSEAEITAFYDQHREHFILKDNYFCGIFMVLSKNAPQIQKVRAWMLKGDNQALENIEKYCLQNAISYKYYNQWTDFSQITQALPIEINNQAEFLSKNKFYETQDSTQHYLLKIAKFCIVGQQKPYELAKAQIIEILNLHENADYFKKLNEDLYQDALKNNLITFY
ncbi:MAG: peptidyl-prolyl cis-trans isomerase [Paludibacter sp.]|jgi:hypothetical protein|nr:peptidyl-prolyl cis-trans isomerase [Paludibacter sp.]